MKTSTEQKGFTIIETLVAVSILMMAIAGPLVVASKSLFGSNSAKNQMVATYLAQESMEVVKNLRDNNLEQGVSWTTGIDNCRRNHPCDASALDGSGVPYTPSIMDPCPLNDPCPIYMQPKGFSHVQAGGTATIFSRNFYLHNPGSPNNQCSSPDECSVTVEVYWNELGTENSIQLTSEITSILR